MSDEKKIEETKPTDELNEKELEQVAGGVHAVPMKTVNPS